MKTPFLSFASSCLASLTVSLSLVWCSPAAERPDKGRVEMDVVRGVQFRLEGFVGQRVAANAAHWMVEAPKNNPGLLDMFARRDDGQKKDLVPWAGEFVGKYLISGVQALRMSDDPPLKATLAGVVARLIALQAEDGYLGPWPKAERLRGQWDLWGHYHILLGLIMWHEHTGEEQALTAARRIADLVCRTCLDTNFRVFDAGAHEMNMGIIHGLTRLHRYTGEARYLRMAQEVLKDFERAGDYYRTGLAGQEFYRTPRPRWESLHSLQGMTELYRITGDETFRRSLLHHWASIRRFDQRNSGAFSSGEQATGSPYVNEAIETCCVVAWQAVMLDALQLTGDPTIADDLELATLNAMLGAQHPSGAWCTYNTPMAGQRIPSHVDIRFQARPDTPHLNCCSVNGPRGYGIISEWGVMRTKDGLAVNYYGPGETRLKLADGTPLVLRQKTDYPHGTTVQFEVEPAKSASFELTLRIPAWSRDASVTLNSAPSASAKPGTYFRLSRGWVPGDRITLKLSAAAEFPVRHEAGDREQCGKASFYRGPVLLAVDSRFQNLDRLPEVDVAKCATARSVPFDAGWLATDLPTVDGPPLRTIDFASAGATTVPGQPPSRYATWLPARCLPPPRPVAWQPAEGAAVGPGAIRFQWRKQAPAVTASCRHTIVVADAPDFRHEVARVSGQSAHALVLPEADARRLQPQRPYYWKIISANEHGQAESIAPFKSFRIDPAAPPMVLGGLYGQRQSDGAITVAPLRGTVKPEYGVLLDATGWQPAPGRDGKPNGAVQVDGKGGMIRYKLGDEFPGEAYTLSIWCCPLEQPKTQYGQVFSAWTAGMDDPLRLFISGGKVAARIEAGRFCDTPAVPVEVNTWRHLAVVKQADKLTLYVDGQAVGAASVPANVLSRATDFALGGNPHFSGPEFLAARLSDLRFFARAVSADELKTLRGEP